MYGLANNVEEFEHSYNWKGSYLNLYILAYKNTNNPSSLLNQDAEIAPKSDPNLARKHGQNSKVRTPSPKISGLLSVRGGAGSMKVYAVGVYIAIILSVLIGVWICPKLQLYKVDM